MLTRALALFISIILGALMFTAGIIAGIGMQADYEDSTYNTSMVQSLKIAVVNQDMGVDYNGKNFNFASDIINTFSDDYILVPKEAAESGIKKGNYAAAISFPGDFSNQVVQINDIKPDTATFKYQLSSNLSQKDCIEVLLKIISVEKNINETLTFMYAASVFGELHDAQSNVKNLLENEEDGIESVYKFVSAEMITGLEISHMDTNIPDVEYPDFLDFMNENDSVLSDLLEKYDNYMLLAMDDYSALMTDAEGVFSDSQSVSDAINGMDILPSDASAQGDFFDYTLQNEETGSDTRFDNIKKMLEQTNEEFASGYEDLAELDDFKMPELSEADYCELYHEKIYDALKSLVEAYGYATSGTTKSPATSGTTNPCATHGTTSDPYINDAAAELSLILQSLAQYQQFLDAEYSQNYILELLLLITENTNTKFTDISDAIDQSAEENKVALEAAIAAMREHILTGQDNARSTLSTAYDERNQHLAELSSRLVLFDPTKYIYDNRDELGKFNTRFRENNQTWNEGVTGALNERSELVFDTYNNYGEYIELLKEDMQSQTTQSRDLFDAELEKLLSAQLGKKDDNIALIGSFAEKLPNTKIGSQENNDFYSFFVSPVKISEVGYGTQGAFRPPIQKGVVNIMFWMQVVIRLLVVLFVLTAGGYFLIKAIIRKKQNNLENSD